MFKHVLFDLDGTLTDSKEGILKSVAYALDKIGEHIELTDDVVGPPLMITFVEKFGFPQEKADKLYDYFQERYSTIGKFENRPYDGIPEMLKTLHDKGVKNYLATSKPTIHARAISDKFGLSPYLSLISGSEIGGSETKAQMIQHVLDQIGPYQNGDVIMVGDRKYDAIGAQTVGIPVILVEYGYADEEELITSQPDAIAADVNELTDLLLK